MCGSVLARPRIISEKKMPTDSTCAEFWKVWFMPLPAPRSSGGRLFITAARLGEANMPIAIPISSSTSPNTGKEKLVGSNHSSMKLIAEPTMPPVAKPRAPKRSDR